MRVVATFDLPSAFVDATVRTTLVIAYKPSARQLKKLQKDDYEFFTKRIEKLGYEVKTISGVKQPVNNYKRDEKFEYALGEDGERIIDSEFDEVYENFCDWAEKQEKWAEDAEVSMIRGFQELKWSLLVRNFKIGD